MSTKVDGQDVTLVVQCCERDHNRDGNCDRHQGFRLLDFERSLKHDLGISDVVLTMNEVPIRPYVSHENRVATLGRYLRGLKFGRPPSDEERELVLNYIRAEMTPGEMEQLSQLNNQGPVFDGDIISKVTRDTLIKLGLAVRAVVRGHQGYTVATYNGWTVLRGLGVSEQYESLFFRDPDSLSDQERHELWQVWERETQLAAERAAAYAKLVEKNSGPIRNLVRLSEDETRELRNAARKFLDQRLQSGTMDGDAALTSLFHRLLKEGKLGSDQLDLDDQPDRCTSKLEFNQKNLGSVDAETALWYLRCDRDLGHEGEHHTNAGSNLEYTWTDDDKTPIKTQRWPSPTKPPPTGIPGPGIPSSR